ncbi:hypothetical protein QC334_17470 [Streptomyces sp. DH18]|uniref:hypothetical protein n=1 Tax=Streptomyces sp. DH18 TaxID=3040126 RepID=UPI002441B904|nr:hypothetical protein [Streptomyces sp. DH18]MDG9684488.1 hypothetical protein [Streptomyces sp. DH18]
MPRVVRVAAVASLEGAGHGSVDLRRVRHQTREGVGVPLHQVLGPLGRAFHAAEGLHDLHGAVGSIRHEKPRVGAPWPGGVPFARFGGEFPGLLLYKRQFGVAVLEDCRDALCLLLEIGDLLGRLADELLGYGGVQSCPVGPVGQLEETAVDLGPQLLQTSRRRGPVSGRRTQLAQVNFDEIRV